MSNIIGLVILIVGSMALNQYTNELVRARVDNLHSQAKMITSIMGETASGIGSNAELDVYQAKDLLKRLDLPPRWRVRLHDRNTKLLVDSEQSNDTISVVELDPIGATDDNADYFRVLGDRFSQGFGDFMHNLPWRVERRERLQRDLFKDVRTALSGRIVGGERYNDDDSLVVTVTMPVKRVEHVIGALTLESADVDDIIDSERRALTPFIGLAILAALLSSIALTMSIVYPLRQLSHAAEIVASSNTKRGDIPNFSSRGDEIGDLSVVLRNMTTELYTRIDDIANFAADVAHEIKNPLTSLRSASDTLRHVKSDERREKLIDIIQKDVVRMDRLITDISKASKVDAELARDTAEPVDVSDILSNLTEFYGQTRSGEGATVVFDASRLKETVYIRAFETPFAQVLRNLIDNALTFSPVDGTVRLRAWFEVSGKEKKPEHRVIITVDDDGPGIPPDNLETIFERFYTERPKGAQFGSHSGLGLAICKQIMSAHNGTIRAENRMSGDEVLGARFILTLPRHMASLS